MAIEIPNGCYRQTTESEEKDRQGIATRTVVVKGPYDAVSGLYAGVSKGSEIIDGYVMESSSLTRSNSAGVATFVCIPVSAVEVSLSEVWTLRSVRNDKSILAYCGDGDDNPSRALIEAWQKEPDGSVAMLPGFTKSDGSIFVIGTDDAGVKATATNDLLTKILKGIDSVMRFYPMLTKTRTYAKPPETVYEHLAEIDVPVVGEADKTTGKLFKPGNLDDIIKGHTWVKCQDDVTLQADGKFVRTESWMGFAGESVDVNLYGSGEQRWEMPYCHSKHGGN